MTAGMKIFGKPRRQIIDEYETMVDELGLVAIDATRPIEEQQAEVRRIVTAVLEGTKKTQVKPCLG
jgi:thymidylate kinase